MLSFDSQTLSEYLESYFFACFDFSFGMVLSMFSYGCILKTKQAGNQDRLMIYVNFSVLFSLSCQPKNLHFFVPDIVNIMVLLGYGC